MSEQTTEPFEARRKTEATRIRQAYRELGARLPADIVTLYRRHSYMAVTERDRRLLEELDRRGRPVPELEILDVGCGTGGQMARLIGHGAAPDRLHGIDLISADVEAAADRLPACDLRNGDASELPHESASMDVVMQGTVLSSILDDVVRQRVADEMVRVCRPGGLVVSYDFVWNPFNRHTRGLGSGEIRRLFAACHVATQRVTLAPPIARRVAPRSRRLAAALGAFVPLRSHMIAFITP